MEPFSLAAIGSLALTEGIKFLYAQAGEVLKRWRATRHDQAELPPAQLTPPEGVLQGHVDPATPEDSLASRLADELQAARRPLADYAEGLETPDTNDEALLEQVDALRCLLEAVYAQRITFNGESRAASGPIVRGDLNVEEIAGRAAAVRARLVQRGQVEGVLKAKRIEPGGEANAVDADRIG
jgi:hypothetical protein